MNSFSNLYPCPSTNGLFTEDFCCGAQEGSSTNGFCGFTNFIHTLLGGFGSFLVRAGSADVDSSNSSAAASVSVSSISSSIVAPTAVTTGPAQTAPVQSNITTPRDADYEGIKNSRGKDVAIGAGIGVPLGVILLAALAFLLYRERKSHRRLEEKLRSLESSPFKDYRKDTAQDVNGAQSQRYSSGPHELHHWARQPELHSQPRVEVAAGV